MSNLTILNNSIRQSDNLYSLTDLHRASGGKQKHKPVLFLSNQQTKELILEIESESEVGIPTSAVKTVRGGSDISKQGTYACEELMLAYAMWISPKFHLVVLRAFLNLHKNSTALLPNTLNPEQQQAIQSAVQQAHHRTGLPPVKICFQGCEIRPNSTKSIRKCDGVHYELTAYSTSTNRRKIYFRFNKRGNLNSYSIVILARSDELVIGETG